jgi:hypothetical protein
MRVFELNERTANGLNLKPLKAEIISGVKATDDTNVLEKVRQQLYSTDIRDKIANALGTDSDAINKNMDQLVDILIKLPGEPADKLAFAKGYPEGYVDINKLLKPNSGKKLDDNRRVHFEDVIKVPDSVPPESRDAAKKIALAYLRALATFTPGTKGPGEFALAVLSPKISIDSVGDLTIGNLKIEVKASITSSGGSLGQSNLQTANIPNILADAIPLYKKYHVNKGFSFSNLKALLADKRVTPEQRKKLADNLWPYMFNNNKSVDLTKLKTATIAADPEALNKEYTIACYNAYQFLKGSKGFDGVLLINYKHDLLAYFDDPEKLASSIAPVQSELVGSQPERGAPARAVLSREKVSVPDFSNITQANLAPALDQLARYIVVMSSSPYSIQPKVSALLKSLWPKKGVVNKAQLTKIARQVKIQLNLVGKDEAPAAAPAPKAPAATPGARVANPQQIAPMIGAPAGAPSRGRR